jgi:putative spermidine/putrescine transport system ATP-binding protein
MEGGALDRQHRLRQGHRLDIEGVTLAYGGTTVVDQVTLDVQPGELVALLGPSGCGKTTLLRAIAGFLRPASGRILFDGKAVDHLSPGQRQIGIVFQSYALFPHMSAAENVAYGLQARRVPRPEIGPRVAAALDAVQMGGFAERRPSQLSGGQQQRVSLARAIVTEPAVLLLDEPFAALDRALRLDLQLEIKRLQRRLGLTAVMVTHDQDEAMSMADRMAVMRAGRLEQVDAPAAVYDAPASRFVAGFVGASVEMPGRVIEVQGDRCAVALDAGARVVVMLGRAGGVGRNSRVVVSARPEHLVLHDGPGPDRLAADLRQSAPIAGTTVHDLRAGGLEMKVIEPRLAALRAPGPVHVGLAASARPALFALDETVFGDHA